MVLGPMLGASLLLTLIVAVGGQLCLRFKAEAASEKNVLRYPRAALVVACVCSVLVPLGVMAIIVTKRPPAPHEMPLTWLSWSLFQALMLLAVLGISAIGFQVDSRGVVPLAPWRRRRLLEWSDVERLDFDDRMLHFRLEGRSGRRLRIPGTLASKQFAALALKHIRPSVLKASGTKMLRRARGNRKEHLE